MARLCYLGGEDRRAFLQSKAFPGTEIGNIDRTDGPKTIESMYEEYLYIPIMIESVVQAEKEGYQAVITGCAGDPGLDAARELVRIPVTGPGESGLVLAAMLGFRFSVITILDSVVRSSYELAHKVGVGDKLASVKSVDVPVLEVRKHEQSTYDALRRVAHEAIEQRSGRCADDGVRQPVLLRRVAAEGDGDPGGQLPGGGAQDGRAAGQHGAHATSPLSYPDAAEDRRRH